MLDNDLGNGLDLLEVSKHVKAQIANVVLKHVSLEGHLDQLNENLRGIVLRMNQHISDSNNEQKFEGNQNMSMDSMDFSNGNCIFKILYF